MAQVVCIGLMVADVFARPVRRLPPPGETDWIDTVEVHAGGDALNNAMTLARLGVDVALIGRIGEDPFGDFIVRKAKAVGVEVRPVRDPDAPTATCLVLVLPDGEHSFLYCPGANARLTLADLAREDLAGARIVHFGSAASMPDMDGEPLGRLFQMAREAGAATSLDVSGDTSGVREALLRHVLPHVDYFLPNESEASGLTGLDVPEEMSKAFLDAGAGTAVIKMGARGCLIRTPDQCLTVPARKVEVVDTTGAGDCFVAGFLAAVLQGWDVERCARLACAVAASCVSKMGANEGVRTLEETLRIMEQRDRKPRSQ